MRAIVAISAVFALAIGVSLANPAQAQGYLQASPPPDSAIQIGQPKFEDIKLQTGISQPPKSGSALVLNRQTIEWLVPSRRHRETVPQARAN